MTQRATSPKPTAAWLTAQEAENQEHIAQAAGSSLGEVSLPGASVWLNLSQAAQAGSASSRQLVWSERLRDYLWLGFASPQRGFQLLLFALAGRGLEPLFSFKDSDKAV